MGVGPAELAEFRAEAVARVRMPPTVKDECVHEEQPREPCPESRSSSTQEVLRCRRGPASVAVAVQRELEPAGQRDLALQRRNDLKAEPAQLRPKSLVESCIVPQGGQHPRE